MADVLGAATVSEAYKLKPLIREREVPRDSDLRVVNSGTIDRYEFHWGKKRMRYLGESFLHPVIPQDLVKHYPSKRITQAKTPKIIIAGMTKVLECEIDICGSYLAGKSTSIILSRVNLYYLLGILNSKLINYYYQSIFGGNKMQGGYLRIGPPQLRQIPVPELQPPKTSKGQIQLKLIEKVNNMLHLKGTRSEIKVPDHIIAIDRRIVQVESIIDELVFGIYDLSDEEISVIERSLS